MKVSVSGIGWVTSKSFGAASMLSRFELTAGTLPKLRRRDVFEQPYQRFGRLDTFSKLGLAGLAFALRDAAAEESAGKRDIGIVAATHLGCLGTDLNYYDTVIPQDGLLASPNLFAYTLPNCFLGEAAIRFGLTGPGYVINEAGAVSLTALQMAMEMVCWDQCPGALAGFCNPPLPEEADLDAPEIPGAVFLFLQPPGAESAYAELALSAGGSFCVGQQQISNWDQLVTTCLEKRSAPTDVGSTQNRL